MKIRAAILAILLTVPSTGVVAGDVLSNSRISLHHEDRVLAETVAVVTLRDVEDTSPTFEWSPSVGEKRWMYIVVHHSATSAGSVDSIHQEHSRRKDSAGNNWLGIGYHFVIGNGTGMEDGAVEPTFRWRQQIHGAHCGSAVHNAAGIGVCLIGDFQKTAPSEKQLHGLTTLIGQLARRYQISSDFIIGHNTLKPTLCPGKLLPLANVIRNAVGEVFTVNN